MVGHTINLISRTHRSCEKNEYTFIVFREYTRIFSFSKLNMCDLKVFHAFCFACFSHFNLVTQMTMQVFLASLFY